MFLKKMMRMAMAIILGVCFLTPSIDAFADTAGECLRTESVGASIVFNTNAYNDAGTQNLGIDAPRAEEINSNDLVMVKVSSVLNVRSEGNSEAEIVGKIYRDCGGIVLEKGEEWSLIESGDLVGWCSNEYLLFDEDAVALAKDVGTMTAVINCSCAKVHSGPSELDSVLSLVSQNTLFEVIYEVNDEWICIALDDCDGFIRSEYVNVEFNIDHGETMEAIKARRAKEEAEKRKLVRQNEAIEADGDTLKMLATIIWCEARGEGYEGQLAVGSCVMNRVRSGAYPNSVYDVIFASGQFSPVKTGNFQKAYNNDLASESCYNAAQAVLDGYTNIGDMTHFRRKGNKDGYIIGNHVFY